MLVARRTPMLVALVAIAASLSFVGNAGAARTQMSAQPQLAGGILVEINRFRTAHRLHTVTLSRQLSSAAGVQTTSMARYGFFAHESHDGSAFWLRIQRSYRSAGYGTWSVGENLLWATDTDAAGAMALWVASPHHLANLLDPRWRRVGISAIRATAAPGVYGGQDVTIVATDFGARS